MKIKLYAAVAAFVLAPAPAAASPPPSEWPQAGYGGGNTYYNPGESRLNAGTIGGIRQRWSVPTHSARHCEVGGAPVLAGGRVFTTDPGGLGAYDPATGARRWHVELPQTTVWRLAVADGKLIVLSSACRVPTRFQSNLTAYEPATGARIWSSGLAKYSFDMRIDRGVVALDSNQDGLASTIAYGVADGRFRWLRKGDRGDGLISAGGRLLLRRESGGAVAVSITDGRTLWQTPSSWYAVGSDPAGRRFYVGGPGLTAVDAATGRPLWASPLEAFAITSDERHVYFGRARSVECLDAATGRKLWSVHLPGLAGRSVRAGGLLYVAGATLEIRNADTGAATGKPEKSGIAGSVDRPPVVADGRLFVTDGDNLRAYY